MCLVSRVGLALRSRLRGVTSNHAFLRPRPIFEVLILSLFATAQLAFLLRRITRFLTPTVSVPCLGQTVERTFTEAVIFARREAFLGKL